MAVRILLKTKRTPYFWRISARGLDREYEPRSAGSVQKRPMADGLEVLNTAFINEIPSSFIELHESHISFLKKKKRIDGLDPDDMDSKDLINIPFLQIRSRLLYMQG